MTHQSLQFTVFHRGTHIRKVFLFFKVSSVLFCIKCFDQLERCLLYITEFCNQPERSVLCTASENLHGCCCVLHHLQQKCLWTCDVEWNHCRQLSFKSYWSVMLVSRFSISIPALAHTRPEAECLHSDCACAVCARSLRNISFSRKAQEILKNVDTKWPDCYPVFFSHLM